MMNVRADILEQAIEMCHRDDNEGICLSCGEHAYGVEPDARKYPCEACGQRHVYGAQEIILMGVA